MKIQIECRVGDGSDLRVLENDSLNFLKETKEYKKLLTAAEKLKKWKKTFERCHQKVNVTVKKVTIRLGDGAEVLVE